MGVRFLVYVGLVQGIEVARRERASHQYVSRIELFGEALDDEARLRPFVIALPESGGTSPVDPIVAVMKGNNPESACLKNVAAYDSRAASDQQVEIERFYFFDVLVGKPIHQAGLGDDGRQGQHLVDQLSQIERLIMVRMQAGPLEQQGFYRDDQPKQDFREQDVRSPLQENLADLAPIRVPGASVDDEMGNLDIGTIFCPEGQFMNVFSRKRPAHQQADLESLHGRFDFRFPLYDTILNPGSRTTIALSGMSL